MFVPWNPSNIEKCYLYPTSLLRSSYFNTGKDHGPNGFPRRVLKQWASCPPACAGGFPLNQSSQRLFPQLPSYNSYNCWRGFLPQRLPSFNRPSNFSWSAALLLVLLHFMVIPMLTVLPNLLTAFYTPAVAALMPKLSAYFSPLSVFLWRNSSV